MFTDPISDMLTRIRNGVLARKTEVLIPYSKVKFEIAKILMHENYIQGFDKVDSVGFPHISVVLKYDNKQPVINHIQRISKPGLRVYVKKDELPNVLNGLGMAIISTPQGLMTNKQAKREGMGGEVICEVY